jgi:hypothetical protein
MRPEEMSPRDELETYGERVERAAQNEPVTAPEIIPT